MIYSVLLLKEKSVDHKIYSTLMLIFRFSGSSWPTAQLVDPPDGILIVGEGRSAVISFNVDGNPFPRDKKWYKDGNVISSSSSIL